MNRNKKGFTLVELLVVIGILGILMGALFPVISSAMLSANLSTMSMQGRKIIQGMMQANIERQGHSGDVWPKDAEIIFKLTAVTDGAPMPAEDEITLTAASNEQIRIFFIFIILSPCLLI